MIDISGSMAELVPGTGLTRMQVTTMAATQGLTLFPGNAEVGLWEFSVDLDEGRDYRELVPIRPLDTDVNGATQHETLTAAAWLGLLWRGEPAALPIWLAEALPDILAPRAEEDGAGCVLRAIAECAIGFERLLEASDRAARSRRPVLVGPRATPQPLALVPAWDPPTALDLAMRLSRR